jgi:hypothetical protein
VGQRHLARHRPVPAADQQHIRDGVVGSAFAFASTSLGTGGGVWQKKHRGGGCRLRNPICACRQMMCREMPDCRVGWVCGNTTTNGSR